MRYNMRFIFLLSLFIISGCSTTYSNKQVKGENFPSVIGTSLEQESVSIPEDFVSDFSLLLVGYKQDSQFDIDRWLIGLDMKQINIPVYEIPTIQGMFPRIFKTYINNGMRAGIPKPLWKGVITVYKEGDKVQKFTGNENPNNARVLLLNKEGVIVYFYDEGFSVSALNELSGFLFR